MFIAIDQSGGFRSQRDVCGIRGGFAPSMVFGLSLEGSKMTVSAVYLLGLQKFSVGSNYGSIRAIECRKAGRERARFCLHTRARTALARRGIGMRQSAAQSYYLVKALVAVYVSDEGADLDPMDIAKALGMAIGSRVPNSMAIGADVYARLGAILDAVSPGRSWDAWVRGRVPMESQIVRALHGAIDLAAAETSLIALQKRLYRRERAPGYWRTMVAARRRLNVV